MEKPDRIEIAVLNRDPDMWTGFLDHLENPDPVLRTRACGRGLRLYDDVARDAHAGSVLRTRYLAVAGLEWTVEPGGSSAADARAADLVRAALSAVNFSQATYDLMQAVLYGFYVCEALWEVKDGLWVPKKLIGKHPRRFAFTYGREPRLLTLDNGVQGETLPPRKFITHTWGDSDNPYGRPLGQTLYWSTWFKKAGIKWWLVFLEKFGSPTALGKYPAGSNEKDIERLLSAMDAIQQEACVAIPEGMAVNFLEASRTGQVSYMEHADWHDAQISKAVLGQTATTEGTPGRLGSDDAQSAVRADIIKADADLLAETWNQTLVRWIAELNVAGAAPPRLWYRTESAPDRKEVLEIAERAARMGVPVPVRHIYDDAGVPRPDGDEPLLGGGTASGGQNGGEFAERRVPDSYAARESHAAEGQRRLDAAADGFVREGADAAAGWIAEIKDLLEKAESLEQAADALPGLYPKSQEGPFQDALYRALTEADRIGAGGNGAEFSEGAGGPWGPGKPFTEASDFFQARAFTIAGVARADLLADVKGALLKALEEGETLKEFQARADSVFEARGWAKLRPWHIETIFRTNMQAAYQAGRYRRLTDPVVLRMRPFWRYSAVLDASTRPLHAALHGRIFRHDSPFWQKWYPPNGFNCRCTVVSVSQAEMERNGWKAEEKVPEALEIVDPVTGETGQPQALLPEQGWGGTLGSLEAEVRARTARGEAGQIKWKVSQQKSYADFGRPAQGDIREDLPSQPPKLPALSVLSGRLGDSSKAFDAVETEFRRVFGMSPKETTASVRTADGHAVTVDFGAVAHAMLKGDEGGNRERFLAWFKSALERPYEIWLTQHEDGAGNIRFRRRYIALFKSGEAKTGAGVIVDEGPGGMLLYNLIPLNRSNINGMRKGVRLLWPAEG
jgi:SPP1 gp7 family putative phage head morphogenesis protein